MVTEWEAVFRIALAAVLGGIVGLEREFREKPAGLRTHVLVAEGAALFMVASILLTQEWSNAGGEVRVDPSRIGSTIVTGVGFLGGGMILKAGSRVYGLTTAAGIWVAAALGMLVGAGQYVVPIFGTLLAIVTLFLLQYIEDRIGPSSSTEPGYDEAEEE